MADEAAQSPAAAVPTFTLFGSDPDAPDMIYRWAEMRRQRIARHALNLGPTEDLPEELRKALRECSDGELAAWDMRRFQREIDGDAPSADALNIAAEKLRCAARWAEEAKVAICAAGALREVDEAILAAAVDGLNMTADACKPGRGV